MPRDRTPADTPRAAARRTSPSRRAAAGLAALVLAVACGPADGPAAPDAPRRNLVVVLVDTLRADHLGFHGYARDTSPFLDELAAEGVVFERAYSPSAFTRESVAALLTGRLPSLSGSLGWYAAPSDDLPTLGESYQAAGYRTGFFTTTIMLGNERFTRGFDDVDQMVEKGGVSGMGHELTERALRFVRDAGDEPFMMYVHYFDPHGPYEPPEALYTRFADEVFADPIGLYTELRPRVPEYVAQGFGPGDPRYEDQQVRYDAEIVDTDDAIRALVDGLREAGVADDTTLVLTSDHGEEFLEHGFVEHAWTLYEESVHVPLVVWDPSRLPPARVSRPVSLVDVVPTVTALHGVSRDGRPTDGHVLLDVSGAPSPPAVPVVSELLVQHRNVVRSVVVGPWKYLQARRWLNPVQRSVICRAERKHELAAQERPFDPWSPVVHEELYDLSQDPGERRDLSGTEPTQLARMREVLAALERRAKEVAPGQQGRADEQEMDQEMLDAIKAIGY